MKNLSFISDKGGLYFFKVWKYCLWHRNGQIVNNNGWEIKKISKMILNINLN